jgi:uncharacterized FlaG/YvyC family protein
MASDLSTVQIPVANVVQGSSAAIPLNPQSGGGSALPQAGSAAGAAAASGFNPGKAASTDPAAAHSATDAQTLVDQLNKHLNDSGRPDQFRVAPASDGKIIQQINPSTGEIVGQFSASEFPTLARSVGASGLLFDSRA